jgi:hypothetical protein
VETVKIGQVEELLENVLLLLTGMGVTGVIGKIISAQMDSLNSKHALSFRGQSVSQVQ